MGAAASERQLPFLFFGEVAAEDFVHEDDLGVGHVLQEGTEEFGGLLRVVAGGGFDDIADLFATGAGGETFSFQVGVLNSYSSWGAMSWPWSHSMPTPPGRRDTERK